MCKKLNQSQNRPLIVSLTFKYNDSGLRTHKTVTQNGVTTTYTYAWSQDNRLISQTDGTTTLHFIYDENDEIIGFAKLTEDSSEMFYYVKNLQGDVYAIVDSNGTVVAEYLYDAWGYLLEITGSQADTIGELNPIRYRGYYYDTETGYYYLQSRYYDPAWGRFVNADMYVHTGSTILGGNMFAYCKNNPLAYKDPSGKIPITACIATGLVLGSVFGAIISYSKYKTVKWQYVTVGALFGVAIGATFGFGIKYVGGMVATLRSSSPARTASKLAKNVYNLKYSKSIQKYMDPNSLAKRVYYGKPMLIKEIIESAIPVKDTSLKNGVKWVVAGSMHILKNGTPKTVYGVWELVIDVTTNTIVHFLFKS